MQASLNLKMKLGYMLVQDMDLRCLCAYFSPVGVVIEDRNQEKKCAQACLNQTAKSRINRET